MSLSESVFCVARIWTSVHFGFVGILYAAAMHAWAPENVVLLRLNGDLGYFCANSNTAALGHLPIFVSVRYTMADLRGCALKAALSADE